MSRKQTAFLAAAAILATAVTGAVFATPASGVLSSMEVARGEFEDEVDIQFKIENGNQEVHHVRDAQQTVMQQIVFGPGGQAGWHSHPGPVVVIVKSGTLTFYSGEGACIPRDYSAGESFIDSGQGHVHTARNLSQTENVELWVTYFDVPVGGSPRIDANDPGNCIF